MIMLVKGISQLIVSIGVGTIVTNVVKATTPKNIGRLHKICVGLGSFVLSGIVIEKAATYTDKSIDETIKDVIEIREMMDIEE